MAAGVTTPYLSQTAISDGVVVNRDGTTMVQPTQKLALQLLADPAFSTSAFATIAVFRSSLAALTVVAPAIGTHGAVLTNDETAGIYEYTGGGWVWRAPIPAILTESLAAIEAREARDQVMAALATIGSLAQLEELLDEARAVVALPLAKGFQTRAQALLTTEDLSLYGLIVVSGYAAPGDGGAAHFIRAAAASPGSIYAGGYHWRLSVDQGVTPAQVGAKGDNLTDDTPAFVILEALGPRDIDLGGKTYKTTLSLAGLINAYHNGEVTGHNTYSWPGIARTRAPLSEAEIRRTGTKCPFLAWPGAKVGWWGTSLVGQGRGVDSYAELAAKDLDFIVRNMAWGGSHMYFNGLAAIQPTGSMTQVLSLSMTMADVDAGNALFGPGSVFDDAFDPLQLNFASAQTADKRIDEMIALEGGLTVAMVDHGHNDRYGIAGTLEPPSWAVTAVTKGATTVVTVPGHNLVVGDGAYLRVNGIAHLDWAAARVQAVAGNVVTLAHNSAPHAGAFVSGQIVKCDRSTTYGAADFILARIRNANIRACGREPVLILASPPSEFSTPAGQPAVRRDAEIWSAARVMERYASARNLAYFDILQDMRVGLQDHLTYFQDWVHPTDYYSRRVIANHWTRWMQGGAPRTISTEKLLSRGAGVTLPDQTSLVWSRMHSGLIPAADAMGDYATLVADAWAGSLAGWTIAGTPPVIAAAPWGGQGLRCNAAAAGSSWLSKTGLAWQEGYLLEAQLWLPQVTGLTTASAAVINLMQIRHAHASGANLHVSLQLLVSAAGVWLRPAYFSAPPNVGLALGGASSKQLTANTLHHLAVEGVRDDGTGRGRLAVRLDGKNVIDALVTGDSAQTTDVSFAAGIISNSLGAAATLWLGEVRASTRSRRAAFSGLIPPGASIRVANGLITGHTEET